MATLKNSTINNGSYLVLPIGTDAQRPSTPSVGMIRINSQRKSLEVYHLNRWRKVSLTVFNIS
jgi:hypothetical protein